MNVVTKTKLNSIFAYEYVSYLTLCIAYFLYFAPFDYVTVF